MHFSGIAKDESDEGHLASDPPCPDWPERGPDAASICDDRLVPEVASRWLLGSLAGEELVQARRQRSQGALTL